MNWSARSVSNTLQVERYTVNDIMVSYIRDEFYVNRRYQRKLVWSLEEKQLLIDSMIKGIPLPAILLVKFTVENNNILEIVDGLQRLNAITSFILGQFSIDYEGKYCYFDPNSYNETFQLYTEGKIDPHDSLLPKDLCLDFTRYQLPAIITGKDDDTIETIFSRINSTGHKISGQDLRQSTAVGEFPDLVRRIASNVRGDYTYDDRICLCDIPKISVGAKKYGYGVDIDTIFWRRHDLMYKQHIKESKDEEIIETLLATILLGDNFKKNKDTLDNLYKKGTELNNQIEKIVNDYGKDLLEGKFKEVFDTIDMIFDSVHSDFSTFLFDNKKISGKDECFKILFLAIYKLLDNDYIIYNYEIVATSIKTSTDIFNRFINNKDIKQEDINNAVENIYKLLKPAFTTEYNSNNILLEQEINELLSYSIIESQMVEFKIGISDFTTSKINHNSIHKIAKTLVAMSNTNNMRRNIGYVIIGIADTKKSYDEWYKVYKEQSAIRCQHYVPGISCEAKKLYPKSKEKKTDVYLQEIRNAINNEPISAKLKDFILDNFELINYYNAELIIIKSKNMGEISLYDGSKYVRHGNETIQI